MINLLPQYAQRKIMRLYRMRLMSTALFLVAFTFLSAAALLVPSYVITLSHENSAEGRRTALDQKIEEKQGNVAIEVIASLNHQMNVIDSFREATTTSEILVAVYGARISGVRIDSLSFEPIQGNRAVIITGVAATREVLLAFTQELKRLPLLSQVTLPVSNLAEATNNRFIISATLTNTEIVTDTL